MQHNTALSRAIHGYIALLSAVLAITALALAFVKFDILIDALMVTTVAVTAWFLVSRRLANIADGEEQARETMLDSFAKGDIGRELPPGATASLRRLQEYLRNLAISAQAIAEGKTREWTGAGEQDVPARALASAGGRLRRFEENFQAVAQGKLTDVDHRQCPGVYGELLENLLHCRQKLAKTSTLAVAALDAIAQGRLPEKPLLGAGEDGHEVEASVNAAAEAMQGLSECIHIMQRMTVNDYTQKVTGNYPGIFKDIAGCTNEMRRRTLSVIDILEHVANGEYAADLAGIIQRGKASEHDSYRPTTIRMMQSIDSVASDSAMLFQAAVEGRLTVRGDTTRHKGQFRNIMQGVNDTLDAVIAPMQEAGRVLRRIAEGDLTARVTGKYKGDHAAIQADINAMADHLEASFRSIQESTGQLTAASKQLQAVSSELNRSAEQTAAQAQVASSADEQVSQSTSTVATSTEQMTASIREIAHNAAQSARIAQEATLKAQAANDTVAKLGASSAEIGDVVKVITTIAQQTNLLALNATIEAARAGEAGKGFAVVANEVKELAKETAKATEDIGRRIESVQNETASAVTAISEITGIITEVSGISGTIASAVEEQTATTNEMSRNIAEAAKGSLQISENIRGVAEAARNTSDGAGRTQAAATELSQMAASLQSLVKQFKFGSRMEAEAPEHRTSAKGMSGMVH